MVKYKYKYTYKYTYRHRYKHKYGNIVETGWPDWCDLRALTDVHPAASWSNIHYIYKYKYRYKQKYKYSHS